MKEIKIDEELSKRAEQNLTQAMNLNYTAREIKKAALKHFYPHLSDEEIEKKVKEIFLNART